MRDHKLLRFNGAALLEARKHAEAERTFEANTQLQWGRAFRSAETALEKAVKENSTALQWGRAFRSAETSAGVGELHKLCVASMGPRF